MIEIIMKNHLVSDNKLQHCKPNVLQKKKLQGMTNSVRSSFSVGLQHYTCGVQSVFEQRQLELVTLNITCIEASKTYILQ
jgi:hypothetical protein